MQSAPGYRHVKIQIIKPSKETVVYIFSTVVGSWKTRRRPILTQDEHMLLHTQNPLAPLPQPQYKDIYSFTTLF